MDKKYEEYESTKKEVDEMLERNGREKDNKEYKYDPQKVDETLREIDETLDELYGEERNYDKKKNLHI